MKRMLVVAALGLFTVGAFAQGTVNFLNRVVGVVDSPVFRPDGTTKLGAGYWAQLWAGATADSLAAQGDAVQFLNLGTGAASGYFNGGARTINGIAPGGAAFVQVRAWDGKGGTITSWDAAAGVAERGQSATFNLPSTGNPAAAPPVPPVNLVGLTSFNLGPVIPEPTTYALLGLGAAALFLRRRK